MLRAIARSTSASRPSLCKVLIRPWFSKAFKRHPILPPEAPIKATSAVQHGQVLTDDYSWMEDWTGEAMQGHLSSERLYTNSVFGSSDINKIETRLYQEMAERVVASPSTPPPESSGDWLYYQADQSNHSYAVFVRKRVVNASQPQPEEQVILDTSALPQPSDGRPLLIGSMQISRDHTYACFTVDSTGGSSLFRFVNLPSFLFCHAFDSCINLFPMVTIPEQCLNRGSLFALGGQYAIS
jgi:protease II